MTFARLLSAVFLIVIGSITSLAQVSLGGDRFPGGNVFIFDSSGSQATLSEPWRTIPKQPAEASYFRGKAQWPDSFRADHFPEIPQRDADTTCLSMRTYVVARDARDSDSTHAVSYSTCQPTERYRLKSTEIRMDSPDR